MSTDLYILLAIISSVVVCILFGTCCCLLHFITKNRTLVNEKNQTEKGGKNAAQQPLNKLQHHSNSKTMQNIPQQSQIGATSNTSTVISGGQVQTTNSNMTLNMDMTGTASTNSIPMKPNLNTMLSNGQYSDFDPDFLVHPEINYLSASQASNSLSYRMAQTQQHAHRMNNMNMGQPLNAATVTASTSIEDMRRGHPLPLHLNHNNHTVPTSNHPYIVSSALIQHQMEQQRKLAFFLNPIVKIFTPPTEI